MKTIVTIILIVSTYALTYGQETPMLEWAKRLGGPSHTVGEISGTDALGNVYTTGWFQGTTDFDPGTGTFNMTSNGDRDVYISKLNANGEFVWAKQIGGSNADQPDDFAVDADGNLYIGGFFAATTDFDPGVATFNLTASGILDGFTVKLDSDGNLEWATRLGGTGADQIYGITVDALGNVYTTGHFANSVDFDPAAATTSFLTSVGGRDIFALKLDLNGAFIWAKRMGGTTDDEGRDIAVDGSGNVYTTGYFTTTADFDPGAVSFNLTSGGDQDIFVSKLNSNGDFVWAGAVSGPADFDTGQSIAVDGSGNAYVTGYFRGTADFDIGASTFDLTSAGDADMFVLKLNPAGTFAWAKRTGSTLRDDGNALTVDNTGNVYIAGFFQGTVDFDPNAGTFNLTSAGQLDPFITKLTPAGNFVWVVRMGGTLFEQPFSIHVDAAMNVYSSGMYTSTSDFDPGACTFNLTLTGTSAGFVQKLRQQATSSDPTITSFTPGTGGIGTTATITGTNFSATPATNVVAFNGTAAVVTASTTTSITTTVPVGATTGKISLTLNCVTVQSATDFVVSGASVPTITNFTPASGPIGTTVTINGTNFSATPANNTVAFNGTTTTATASTTTSITTTIPASATTGKITVTVAGNTATSATDFTVTTPSLPTITSFTPSSGIVGATVTITGTNFSATAANNAVQFNGTNATATASTSTSITTTVPTGATTGKITVTVSGNTATSATDFTVTTAVGIVINPQPQSIATCEGATETFSIGASGAANITYQWQKFNGTVFANIANGGGYSGVTTKDLTINTNLNFGAGDYRCRVSGDATADVLSQTVSLEINPYPIANITSNGTSLVASPGDSYQWYQNGNEAPQATEQMFGLNVAEYGTYVVEVTTSGCTSASDEFVYLITATETVHEELRIYPNPFKDHIAIELPSEEHFNIKIIDALGRTVKKYSADRNSILHLDELGDGTYILIVQKGTKLYHHRLQKVE